MKFIGEYYRMSLGKVSWKLDFFLRAQVCRAKAFKQYNSRKAVE